MGWTGLHGKSIKKDFFQDEDGMADKVRTAKFVEDWKLFSELLNYPDQLEAKKGTWRMITEI